MTNTKKINIIFNLAVKIFDIAVLCFTGRVSMFTSGSENVHYVERVTSGTRYALTVSFTCDQKYAIDDPTLPPKEMKQ
jgi:hypothetical protein